MSANARIQELGITLPEVAKPAGAYVPAVQSGNLVFTAGQLPVVDGKLVKEGKKKILAFSPAFVADCLETTIEVGEEYKELFEEAGGEHWQLVESLNNSPEYVTLLEDLVKNS